MDTCGTNRTTRSDESIKYFWHYNANCVHEACYTTSVPSKDYGMNVK